MKLCIVVVLALIGCVFCQETEPPTATFSSSEWDCSQDHRPSPNNPRQFLLSPSQTFSEAHPFVATCPPLTYFVQIGTRCRCDYIPELQALLAQPCQLRAVPGNPDMYQFLYLNLIRDNIEDLYVDQNCNAVLTPATRDYYRANGVQVPLFFNASACQCQWTEGALRLPLTIPSPVETGRKCEVLVSVTFTSSDVSLDEVGNYISVFPSAMQQNVSVQRGAAAFGNGLISQVVWRPQWTDTTNSEWIARFIPDRDTAGFQCIFSNICQDAGGAGGLIDLQYNPGNGQYLLQAFGTNTVTCSPGGLSNINGEQIVRLSYQAGSVSLIVNNFECNVDALNPVAEADAKMRVTLNRNCPIMLGSQVNTNPLHHEFGKRLSGVQGFQGLFVWFAMLRDCSTLPSNVADRVAGAPIA